MSDSGTRSESVFFRMTTHEIGLLDKEVERRRKEDPGATISRSSVARSILMRALSEEKRARR